MPKRNHPSDRSSKPFDNQGFRGANPELFESPPGTEWESKGLQNKRSDLNDPKRFIYQFPIPARLASHCKQQIPIISFGDNAPVPRWRLASDPTDPALGRDLEKDLIRTVAGKTIIHGVAPDSHPKSFDSSIGLGGLQWVFDPGLLVNHHNQLHGEPLYEMAYYCLIEALKNQISRTQMRREIANGPPWPEVCNVEDPLPPPPERPKTNFWTRHLNISNEAETRSDNKTYMRPRIDARSKRSIPVQASTPTYSDRLWYHEKGTQGPLHQAGPQGTSSINHEEVSNTSDYEKDKTAKTGEYKCVWFCVILLVLSMFLCLFMYSFGILKVM